MKPTVYYRPHPLDLIDEGMPALLILGTLDHPTLKNDGGMVWTSDVLRVEGGSCPPIFETENNWYAPAVRQ